MRGFCRLAAIAGAAVLLAATSATAAPVSVGHSGWTWANPSPQGEPLYAVAFSGSTGYAVGRHGTILKSINGGATWTGLPNGAFSDSLAVVQELNPSTVIVAGGCTVAESTDGGASFRRLAINTGGYCLNPATGLAFTSPSTGYVQHQDGRIDFTDNGGRTVLSRARVPLRGGGSTASGLHFISATTGFSVTSNGAIERTTDGARSWTTVASAGNGLNALTFVDATTAFAVGDGATVLESTDGGATWAVKPLALPSSAGRPDLESVSCSDPSDCVMATFSPPVVRTADGGMTGSVVSPSVQDLDAAAFTTGMNVVAVGNEGTTVLSPDGGATFPTTVSHTVDTTEASVGEALAEYVPDPLRAGGTNGDAYMLGDGGRIEATTDGGASWTTLYVPGGGSVVDAAFPTTAVGYVITANNVLHKMIDRGATWRSLHVSVTGTTALASTGPSDVLLVGPKGIRRSTDGGHTFSTVGGAIKRLPLSRSLTVGHTIFVYNSQAGYESTNDGSTWRSIRFPANAAVRDLSFVNATTGYVAAAGDILFTRNTGRTWRRLRSVGLDVDGISFSSARTGFALTSATFGADFDVLATTNGGTTWVPEITDGGLDETVLATPGHAYLTDPSANFYNTQGDPNTPGPREGTAIFSTSNNGTSPRQSKVTLSIGPKNLHVSTLRRAHNRITITGRVSPVPWGKAPLLVEHRRPAVRWTEQFAPVTSSGRFRLTIKNIKATTDFVVYTDGDGLHGGAEAYARLTVR